ncbi:G-protein coupled receptor Mth-like isoform X2 [Drosophila elegans]|uniref:G-protein coupled receptor Mth-like isoform X2 n=1 Tax=Drosophila elegans TaxID=30023 RepID=UPI0007E7BD6B|nr:G-protein coupled receptor Mth-like isoform X2 [Drosophila elegans]
MRLLLESFTTVLLLMVKKTNSEILGCVFDDTVDISASQKLSNGSYLYEGLLVPVHLTGKYNFKIMPDGSKKETESHLRGCVCKLKPCVRFCCPENQKMDRGKCHDEEKDKLDGVDPFVNITLRNGSVVIRHYQKDLIVQWDLPFSCNRFYLLDNRNEMDEYNLFENGTFLRNYDDVYLNKGEYCLQHHTFADGNKTYSRIVPINCYVEPPTEWKALVLLLSLICLVFTISVYLVNKKLRNLKGKCFICYMVALFMAYLLLFLSWLDLWFDFCQTPGFLTYFFFMSAFLWLSVISRHIWKTLTKCSHSVNLPKRQFLAYNTFAWGMAAVLTGVTFIADRVVENKDWSPLVSIHCFINNDMSAWIYLFGPMQVLFMFNITMFILTVIHILKVKRVINNLSQQEEGTQSFTFFLRLFVVMGLSWSLEVLIFLLKDSRFLENVFVVVTLFNWSQGILIFVLFVLKRSTLSLLKERFRSSKVSRLSTGISFIQHKGPISN